jgi:hypothetical protein
VPHRMKGPRMDKKKSHVAGKDSNSAKMSRLNGKVSWPVTSYLFSFPLRSYRRPLQRSSLPSSSNSLCSSSVAMFAASRAAVLARPASCLRLRAGMATAAPRIGDTKVAMSLLEKDSYINYQRIEDNLAVVRKRSVWLFLLGLAYCCRQVEPAFNAFREDPVWPFGRPPWARYRAGEELLEASPRRELY